MNLAAGGELGRYRIISPLGAGGMGDVYVADDTALDRKVAIKVLPSEVVHRPDRLRRFEQEARATSALNHPNIITIYEIGRHGDTPFISMELVDGETLRHKLEAGPLDLREALAIATQIASGLDAAHRSGIVHRDIKPDNIMVRADGLVKVLDFGLAKLTEGSGAATISDPATATQLRTTPGTVMGTVTYMSPEQARGLDLDARTDIFSLGVVLYEMLVGHLPFAGDTANDVIASILKSEPAPVSQFATVPPELERIVDKALRKNPDDRYQHVRDLMIDLRDLQQELQFAERSARSVPERPGKWMRLAVGVAAAGIAALVYLKGGWRQVSRNAPLESIAVLPFENAARDPNIEYLSDGVAESLINRLSQLSGLKVMSSSATFRYKGKTADAQTVGRALNVRAVASGSVKQLGDRLVINVFLDDAKDNHRIWGEQYVRSLSDVVSVQNEIAQEVAANLRLQLTGADQRQLQRHETTDAEAYQLYLKGWYEWKKHTEQDLRKAIGYFEEALAKDPNYALAYFGLSASYGVLANAYLPPAENFPKAKAYAEKALAIDETLAEGHTAMGAVRLFYDWNIAEADKEFQRAQALKPSDADAHQMRAALLEVDGRFDEARQEAKRAQELDPLSPMFGMEVAATYYFARRYDEAIAEFEQTIALEPRYVENYLYLGQSYEQKKLYAKAIETYLNGVARAERNPQLIAALGHAYAASGDRANAEKALAQLREMSQEHYVSPYVFAVVYAGLGDRQKAFASLEQAFRDRSYLLLWLKVEPQMDSLRDDPRFQDLQRRIGA